jgi:hypothetical protein
MREPIEIYAWGALVAARLERGSVVLDERTHSVVQLSETAALALDVLADRAPASGSDTAYPQIREALPTVRRELLGESVLAPGEGVTLEGRGGRPLLRRVAEPPHWRRATRARASRLVEITACLVRLNDGVLVVLPGQRRGLAELRAGLAELGAAALPRDVVALDPRAPLRVHSRAWGPSCPVREVWSLEAAVANNLVLARLGHAGALVALLGATTRRPGAEEMEVLASTCLSRPQFRATLPAGAHALAATLRSYGAC